MRWIAVLLLFALPAYPQDAEKLIEQADKLEAKAEKLLDQGKRAEAFDALAKASELRRKAKAGAKAQDKAAAKAAKKAAKKAADEAEAKAKATKTDGAERRSPAAKAKFGLKRRAADPVEIAHAELDLALKAGNLEAARLASERLHAARAEQARHIATLERRLQAMERQMAEIRQLLAPQERRK